MRPAIQGVHADPLQAVAAVSWGRASRGHACTQNAKAHGMRTYANRASGRTAQQGRTNMPVLMTLRPQSFRSRDAWLHKPCTPSPNRLEALEKGAACF